MLRRSKPQKLRAQAAGAASLARRLAGDKQFRKRLGAAIEHATEAGRRAATGRRLAGDDALRAELRRARDDLQQAYRRVQKKRASHRLRNLLVAGIAALAAVPLLRRLIASQRSPATDGLDDLTRDELYARAQEADIPGRSDMTKQELAEALRAKP